MSAAARMCAYGCGLTAEPGDIFCRDCRTGHDAHACDVPEAAHDADGPAEAEGRAWDELDACERRAEAFEPGPTPEEMEAEREEYFSEREAALEHAAECGAEDATPEGDARAEGEARGFAGRMLFAYCDAWADALADDARRAAIDKAHAAIVNDDRTAEERGRNSGRVQS